MALTFTTDDPAALLEKIKKAIDDGNIVTWEYDGDGDFTHTTKQWKNRAWLTPYLEDEKLIFGLIGQKNCQMSNVVYGVYHGRFIEMMLTHFDVDFDTAFATAMEDTYDHL